MTNLFGVKRDPEQHARQAIRRKKWKQAIAYYESRLAVQDRNYGLWNILGDLHMQNGARLQAAEAWRRALEGYALEGLHENVIGIARKLLRRMPEEDDVHLLVAEAYLGLEYHADCFSALRGYLKLSKRRSENDLRAMFRKLLETPITHAHLLDELKNLWSAAEIEDYELQQQIDAFIAAGLQTVEAHSMARAESAAHREVETPGQESSAVRDVHHDGLLGLSGIDESAGGNNDAEAGSSPWSMDYTAGGESTPYHAGFQTPPPQPAAQSAPGDGKDHYDLGMVYKEMKLWDAAITELEMARADRSLRLRSTIALAECLQESHDLQRALALLEEARAAGDSSPEEALGLSYRLGVIHELLGNLDKALDYFESVFEKNSAMGDVAARVVDLRSHFSNASAGE